MDYEDMSCLHYSVYRGDLVMTNALLGAAARAGALRELLLLATDSGDTCLHMAAEYCLLPRGPGVVQALLQAADRAGALLELLLRRSGPGESCLLIAALEGSVDVVNELLEAAGPTRCELLMLTNLVGDSCLYASVEEGRVAAVRTLLEAAGPARRELLLLTNAFGRSCEAACTSSSRRGAWTWCRRCSTRQAGRSRNASCCSCGRTAYATPSEDRRDGLNCRR